MSISVVTEALWSQFGDNGCFFCESPGNVFTSNTTVFTDPEIFDFLKWIPIKKRSGKLAMRIKPTKKFHLHVHDPMGILPNPENEIAIYYFKDYNVVSTMFAPEIDETLTEMTFNVKYPEAVNLLRGDT